MMNARQQRRGLRQGAARDRRLAAVPHCLRRRPSVSRFMPTSPATKNYAQFPDRQGFGLLEELRQEAIRERLADLARPQKLDPTKIAAKATREVAERLAKVSKYLEERAARTARTLRPRAVALFLMRCLFTMFAEEWNCCQKAVFVSCSSDARKSVPVSAHRRAVLGGDGQGGFAFALEAGVRRFNGVFFQEPHSPSPLPGEEIGELSRPRDRTGRCRAPIFGTLLEQALDPPSAGDSARIIRRAPMSSGWWSRQYLEPLRGRMGECPVDGGAAECGRATLRSAAAHGAAFHTKLCSHPHSRPRLRHRQFPLCVAGVDEAPGRRGARSPGRPRRARRFAGRATTIDPHQFLGLEVNPRAAAIAELVLWIGYLQWHFRTRGGMPPEPILRLQDIEVTDAVLTRTRGTRARREAGGPSLGRIARAKVEVYATSTRAAHMAGGGILSSAIRPSSAARIFGPVWRRLCRGPLEGPSRHVTRAPIS